MCYPAIMPGLNIHGSDHFPSSILCMDHEKSGFKFIPNLGFELIVICAHMVVGLFTSVGFQVAEMFQVISPLPVVRF